MKGEIIVVALNMSDVDFKKYDKFNALSAQEKLDIICKNIKSSYDELAVSHPDALIVFAWPEYGITSSGRHHVSNSFKKDMKKHLLDLCKKNSRMAIIAGTLPFVKKAPLTKLLKVTEYYDQLDWVLKLENESIYESEFDKHLLQLGSVIINNPENAYALRNVCYFFSAAGCVSHGKVMPYSETNIATDLDDEVFYQPPNTLKNTSVFVIKHPVTGESVRIGVDICRENTFGIVKRQTDEVDLHFVISSSIELEIKSCVSANVFYLDVKRQPKYLTLDGEHRKHIHFYIQDVCHQPANSKKELHGPYQPLHPFEKRCIGYLQELLSRAKDKELIQLFKDIISNLESAFKRENIADIYDEFYLCIQKINKFYYNTRVTLLVKPSHIGMFKSDNIDETIHGNTGIDLLAVTKNLMEMYKAELLNNAAHKDYLLPDNNLVLVTLADTSSKAEVNDTSTTKLAMK